MSENVKIPTNDYQKLLDLVMERERELAEREARLACRKANIQKTEQKIKVLEERKRQILLEIELLAEMEPFEFIEKSVNAATCSITQAIVDYELLNHLLEEKVKLQEIDLKETHEKCEQIYEETLKKLMQNEQYKELEILKAEYLILDINRRQQEEQVKIQKKIYEQKKEIEDKLYYGEFVEMAEKYVTAQEMEKLKQLEKEVEQQLKKLHNIQEEVKNQNKKSSNFGIKFAKKSGITAGIGLISSEKRFEEQEDKTEQNHTKEPETRKILQELGKMFDEPLSQSTSKDSIDNENVTPLKIRVLDTKILTPSITINEANYQTPSSSQQDKRKARPVLDAATLFRKATEKVAKQRKTNLLSSVQLKKLNDSLELFSQQSQSQNSQQSPSNTQQEKISCSQQSAVSEKLSQKDHSYFSQEMDASQPQESQQQGLTNQEQISTIAIEDTQLTNQRMDTTYDNNEEIECEMEEMEINPVVKPTLSTTPKLHSIMKNSQQTKMDSVKNKADNVTPKQQEYGNKSPVHSSLQFAKPLTPKGLAKPASIMDTPKTVRFNLEPRAGKENCESGTMFSEGFGFGKSSFSPFFSGGGMQDQPTAEITINNTMVNMTETDITGGQANASTVQSPNLSSEDERVHPDTQESNTNNAGFMSGFAGGAFSFGKSMFNF